MASTINIEDDAHPVTVAAVLREMALLLERFEDMTEAEDMVLDIFMARPNWVVAEGRSGISMGFSWYYTADPEGFMVTYHEGSADDE